MDNFNYQEYLRNNPLLKEEVKDQLITESQEVTEEIPGAAITKINTKVTNAQTMAQAILDFINQVQEKESIDYTTNPSMKPILAKLNILAKTKDEVEESEISEDARTDAEQEGYEDGFKDAKDDMKDAMSKMKVSELKAKIRENILSALNEEDEEDLEAMDADSLIRSPHADAVNLGEEEEVDVDIDVEDEVEVDAEADDIEIERKGTKAKVEVGLSPEEEIVQDSLKAAMDAAQALGSDKLADQIGNTITFFTRQFVVGDNTD